MKVQITSKTSSEYTDENRFEFKYKVDGFCCELMGDAFDAGIIGLSHRKWSEYGDYSKQSSFYVYDQDESNCFYQGDSPDWVGMAIKFCPFCGEKFVFEERLK